MSLRQWIAVAVLLVLAAPGCTAWHGGKSDLTAAAANAAPSQLPEQAVQLAAFSQPAPALPETPSTGASSGQPTANGPASKPPTPGVPDALPVPGNGPRLAGPGQPLTLADMEAIALAGNPTLAQAAARVEAARANAFQAGLGRNPVLTYQGSEIGNQGRAGQQGFFVSQEFVTGGKLKLSRLTAEQATQRREYELAAQRFRVLSDVRTQFYEVLTAQQQTDLVRQRVKFLADSADRADRLHKAGEATRIEILQLRIEGGQTTLTRESIANRYLAAWRRLAALTGAPDQPPVPLAGKLDVELPLREWQAVLAQVLENSPEVAAAAAEIDEARWAAEQARAEPIPNVTVQAGAQYDNSTQDTFANVQVGIPVPVFNRNQGGIAKAQADLAAAQRKLAGVQLALEARLAGAFERYANARRQVEGYGRDIEPKAREARDIIDKYYQKERDLATLLLYLSSQRTFFDTQLAYLNALRDLHQSVIALDALVPTGSFTTVTAE